VELFASKQEGSDEHAALPTQFQASWKSCSIGKSYEISISAEETYEINYLSQLFSHSSAHESQLQPLRFRNLNTMLSGVMKLLAHSINYNFDLRKTKIAPAVSKNLELWGLKSAFSSAIKGITFKTWHDSGYSTIKNDYKLK